MEIAYHEKEGLPGKKFFLCQAGMGVINTEFCAASHNSAGTPAFISESKRTACRHCPTGMLHAGTRDTSGGSRLYSSLICARCERWSNRLIGPGHICPSCSNRQAENRRGVNSKNHPLKKIRKYRDVPLLVIKDKQVQLSTARQVMSVSEALLSVLINSAENCAFAWVGGAILPAVQPEIDLIALPQAGGV